MLALCFSGFFFSPGTLGWIGSLGSGIFILVLYFASIYWRLLSVKKTPLENGSILGKKELTVSGDSLYCITENTRYETKLKSIVKIEEGKRALYLYTDSIVVIIVPKRSFKDIAEQKKFIDLAKKR